MLVGGVWAVGRAARFSIEACLATCVAADCRGTMAASTLDPTNESIRGKQPRSVVSWNMLAVSAEMCCRETSGGESWSTARLGLEKVEPRGRASAMDF